MNDKTLLLCSGGFDSITLLYDLVKVKNYTPNDLHLLFFHYGQRNDKQENDCMWRAVFDLDIPVQNVHEIQLPLFTWDNSSLTHTRKEDETSLKSQYMPMRNMIFFSYALSLAQALNCKTVMSAILGCGTYPDTNGDFLDCITDIAEDIGINFEFPYSMFTKYELAGMARMCGLKTDSFFSCNVPNEITGKPCGKCPDCEAVKHITEYYLEDNYPKQILMRNGIRCTDKYKKAYMNYTLEEVRMLINNKCNTQCSHCFYGFKDMVGTELTLDDWFELIEQAARINPNMNFHFSGKEPLYDKFIFLLAEYIESLNNNYGYHLTYDMVTNGINVAKYIDDITKYHFTRVALSVDYEGCTRSFGYAEEAIKTLVEHNISVHCFIVAHKDNILRIPEMIEHLYQMGVKDFFIKDVIDIGHGKNMELLSTLDICNLYEAIQCDDTINSHPDLNIIFYLKGRHFWNLYQKSKSATPCLNSDLAKHLDIMLKSNDSQFGCVTLEAELTCARYLTQISVTPDGYVLGCGTELAVPNYDKFSSGKFDSTEANSLHKLINLGRTEALDKIEKCDCMNSKVCVHKLDWGYISRLH